MAIDNTLQLAELVAAFFGYSEEEITNTFDIYSNISDIDELADFIYKIEETFSIDIDEQKLPLTTFKDLLEYVDNLVNADV